MQPGNIRHRITRHTRILCGFMHISWKTSPCWGRARYACPIAVGHFLPARSGVRSSLRRRKGRKEERAGTSAKSPKRQQRKLDRGAVDGSPLSPKRLHRRREPSPALFQHFATLFYLTPRPTLLCDWIIQIPFFVLSRLPVLVANRAHASFLVHVYPEIFTPWRFLTVFFVSMLLSMVYILMPHASKRPSNSSPQFRQMPLMQFSNIPMFRIGGVWAKTVVAAWTA